MMINLFITAFVVHGTLLGPRVDASSASSGHQDGGLASASINGNLVPIRLQLIHSAQMVALLG